MEPLFEIRKSPIAGNGVFALSQIKKGQTICHLTGELCNLDEIIKRVEEGKESAADCLEVNDDEYLDLDEVPRTFNHSCQPNAFICGKNELKALKDIQINEEITYDYSTTMNDGGQERTIKIFWTCPCHCGAKNCRQTIDQFKALPKKLKIFIYRIGFYPILC